MKYFKSQSFSVKQRRKNIKMFKDCAISITVTSNVRVLPTTHKTEKWFDIYLDINSNHPTQILMYLPKSISKRLSENS